MELASILLIWIGVMEVATLITSMVGLFCVKRKLQKDIDFLRQKLIELYREVDKINYELSIEIATNT